MQVIDGESGEKLLELLKLVGIKPMIRRLTTAKGEPTGRVSVPAFQFKFVHFEPEPPPEPTPQEVAVTQMKKHARKH